MPTVLATCVNEMTKKDLLLLLWLCPISSIVQWQVGVPHPAADAVVVVVVTNDTTSKHRVRVVVLANQQNAVKERARQGAVPVVVASLGVPTTTNNMNHNHRLFAYPPPQPR